MAEVAETKGTVKEDGNQPKDEDGYRMVAIAVDLTGKGMDDEIFHIGAYTMKSEKIMTFDQYVMPYRDVSLRGQRNHGVRVYNSYGVYRILCDVRTGRILRTKSEYSTLNAFIKWLNSVKGNSKGIILVHHGNTVDNMMPYMLQALDRYKLTDAFYELVYGCINCKTIAADYPQMKERSVSMLSLVRRVLNFNEEKLRAAMVQNAKNRAPLMYKIAQKMLNIPDTSDILTGPLESCTNKQQEREILAVQRLKSEKIRSLRPIFISRIRGASFKERIHIAVLRKYLIDNEVDYESLKAVHTSGGKDGVVKIFKTEHLTPKQKQNLDELIGLIVTHFEKPQDGQDINANTVDVGGEKGRGDPSKARASTDDEHEDDDEDDEEFEEAQNGEK